MRATLEKLKSARDRSSSHPGLLLQRYVFHPADGSEQWSNEKRAILQAAINAAICDEVRALYRIAFDRWSTSLPTDSIHADLATPERDSRLIVGLGSENVLETGIQLHHTYGMPIIPGSALKGLAAHYCDQVWGPTDKRFKKPTKTEDEAYRKFLAGKGPKPEDNFHRLLFGNTDDSGCITFHDAWLTLNSPEPLVLDVMTPHHPKWLDGSVAPTDFDSPTPVPFLSATGTFRVAVSWHGPEDKEATCWTERALELLCDALKNWGIGGKTTSGYGRMVDLKDTRFVKTSPSGMTVATPRPASRSGTVRVKILGPHEKLKNAFWVQEEGKKRGLLKYGTPRSPLPAMDSEIEVYPTNDNPNSPEYRWDAPPPPNPPKGGSGGQRPHGRR